MACHLYREEWSAAIPAAACVEVFHNFTLLHDDIMDEASLRRGKDAVHVAYGIPSAILSGDAMLIYAFKYLESYEAESFKKLSSLFSRVSISICAGQQEDMDFEQSEDVSISDYIRMIEHKTSVLLGAAIQMGGIIGGCSESDEKHLYEFGKNIGIAFQIQDDILDVYGDQEKVGKIVAGDIINNKKTYLYLKALELLDEKGKARLIELYNTTPASVDDKIEEVRKLFRSCAAEAYAQELKEAYYTLGVSHLEALNLESGKKQPLRDLAEFLIMRDH